MSSRDNGPPRKPGPGAPARGPAEGSAARIIRNTLANAVGRFSAVLVSLLLTPVLIDRLGLAEYGVWVLAVTLTVAAGYLSLADFGLEMAAGRAISSARGRGSVQEMNRVLSTAVALFTAIGLIAGPGLALLAAPLAAVLSIPESLEGTARMAFALVGLQLIFDLPGRAFITLLTASQLHTRWQALDASRAAISAAVFLVLVILGGGARELAIASLALAALCLPIYALVALRSVPEAAPSPRLIDRATARKLAGFGGNVFLIRVAETAYRQAGKTVVGITLTTSAVATYEIAFNISLGLAMLLAVTTSALFPAAAFFEANRERLRQLLLRGSAYSLAVTLPVAILMLVLADALIRAWIGPEVSDAGAACRILLVAVALSAFGLASQTMLMSVGRIRPVTVLAGIALALSVGISILLAPTLGIEGVALGALGAQAVVVPALVAVALHEFEVQLGTWLRTVVMPTLLPSIVQVAGAFAALPLIGESESLPLVALIGGLTLLPTALTYYASMGTDERRQLVSAFRQATSRNAQDREATRSEVLSDRPAR